jgi:hypothetical protein
MPWLEVSGQVAVAACPNSVEKKKKLQSKMILIFFMDESFDTITVSGIYFHGKRNNRISFFQHHNR